MSRVGDGEEEREPSDGGDEGEVGSLSYFVDIVVVGQKEDSRRSSKCISFVK